MLGKSIEQITKDWLNKKAQFFQEAINNGASPAEADVQADAKTRAHYKERSRYEWCEMREDYVLTEAAKRADRERDMDI